MGSSNSGIKVAIIDDLQKQTDFQTLRSDSRLSCSYEEGIAQFLKNQNMRDIPYLIIRQKSTDTHFQNQTAEVQSKIRESSIVAKSFSNLQELDKELRGERVKSHALVREQIISLVRKYDLEQVVIYLLVEKAFDFKIPEHEEPYIFMVSDDVQLIKKSILTQPQGQESLNFKFRNMVKDLYRRTVVKILNTDIANAKQLKKQWTRCLGPKISSSFVEFNEDDFKSGLISNYYDYIVVSNSASFAFVQDMKKIHKFQSEIIYHGDIQAYGRQQYHQQTEEKLSQVKQCLWMHDESIEKIAEAIKNCTDVLAEETSIVAQNVIIYTYLAYGQEQEAFIVNKLKEYLEKPPPEIKAKSKDITQANWVRQMRIKVISSTTELREQFKKSTFSYLLTFDCDINQIENLKGYLLQEKFDSRVYMYNADEKEDKIEKLAREIHKDDVVRKYLEQRVREVVKKAGFRIKLEIAPVDELTTYNISQKEISKFTSEMGLMTTNINRREFERYYMAGNREKIINGQILVIKAVDYFEQYKKLVDKQMADCPDSYLNGVKVIMMDKEKVLKEYWQKIKEEVRAQRILFVHYNFSKIRDFIEVMVTPRVNLTIFIKKSLPNFYKAHQKIAQNKFKSFELTGSIVSKNKILKEVFGDENFKLTKEYKILFLKLSNSSKNQEEALTALHEEFLYRYGIMWRTGFPIITHDVTKDIYIEALKDNIRMCLYRCKSYFLIDVTEDEFNYFYISKIDQCSTYLQLQVTIIYIYSLPHGLAGVIQKIFQEPLTTILSAKIFSGLVLTLLTAFCSFQDEVMNKKILLIYINDSNFKEFQSIMGALKIGDVLFNRSFLLCGKSHEKTNNKSNNCLFIEFEDIPMLSKTHIKNYVNIQRFAFYKEGCDYLIAPYTEFTVKNIENTLEGKVHVTLSATTDSKKGFVAKAFSANSIDQADFHEVIKEEVRTLKDTLNQTETKKIRETESLYKKAEMVGIYKQKLELIKAIEEGYQYKDFLQAIRSKKYMSALSHLKKKELIEKSTTEMETAYFKNMLGVEKAMLYYNMCEYEMSMKELDRVIVYIEEQNVEEGENWVIKKIKQYKQSVRDLSVKRQKYSNRSEKIKHWKVQAALPEEGKTEINTKMEQKSMVWNVRYEPQMEQFYIQEQGKHKLYYYNVIPAFGDLATSFPSGSSYQTIEQRLRVEEEDILEKKKMQKLQQSPSFRRKDSQSVIESLVGGTKKIMRTSSNIKINEKEDEDLPQTPVLNVIGKQQSFDFNLFEEPPQPETRQVAELKIASIKSVIEEAEEEREENANSTEKVVNEPPKQEFNNFFETSKLSSQLFTESEVLMGVKESIGWQAFFFNGKVVLTQKGKHYKAHMPNKHNF